MRYAGNYCDVDVSAARHRILAIQIGNRMGRTEKTVLNALDGTA